MLVVQICHMGTDGDAAYRIHEPSRFLGRLDRVVAVDCHFAHALAPGLALAADILVLQFVNDWDWLTLCLKRRELGKVTIFEANDDFFDLQSWNPIAEGWSDRLNQELYLRLIREADAVQTSSPTLAQLWTKRGARKTIVFENHLTDCPPLPARPARSLTIGWAGSPGHFADWLHVAPALSEWLHRHPEVHLAVMTNDLARSFFDLPPERYHFVPFGSLEDYYRFLESLDLGIAPLLPTAYNRGRSDVKFIEYASRGVVGLYSRLDPYVRTVIDGQTGLLWDTPDDLLRQLEALLADPVRCQRIRAQAHQYVQDHRLLAQNIGKRHDWYRDLLGPDFVPQAAPDLPGAIWAPEGRYARLEPGPAETSYLEAMGPIPLATKQQRIDQGLAQSPGHPGLSCLKGQVLNDLGKTEQARQILEETTRMHPFMARPWAELGRSWFRLGHREQAQQALSTALARNPFHAPTLLYALRLAKHDGNDRGVRLAETVLEQMPDCYPLGFLSVELLPGERGGAALAEILIRLGQTLQPYERRHALARTRQVLETLLKQGWPPASLDPALEQACRLFPESIAFWRWRGETLLRLGAARADEGFRCLARAAHLLEMGLVGKEEFPQAASVPWEWQFARHIERSTRPVDRSVGEKTEGDSEGREDGAPGW